MNVGEPIKIHEIKPLVEPVPYAPSEEPENLPSKTQPVEEPEHVFTHKSIHRSLPNIQTYGSIERPTGHMLR
jgi:hypothetical protein